MKLFRFKLRKFEAGTTEIEAIETWCVKWDSLHRNCINDAEPKVQVQAFTSKVDADFFAKELTDARRLLGDKWPAPAVYKQNTTTNL